jgi:DNA-binding MarR family transcriptional regulator
MKPVTATAAESARHLSRSRVGYLVYRVERRLRARIDKVVRAYDLSTTEYVTLSVLHRHDGMSCAQLARWSFVTPQAMNLVVSSLEKRGLVARVPDAQHKRVLRTSVTQRGLTVLEQCERSMDEIEADMLADLPPEDVEALRDMLALCARSLEAKTPRKVRQHLTPGVANGAVDRQAR